MDNAERRKIAWEQGRKARTDGDDLVRGNPYREYGSVTMDGEGENGNTIAANPIWYRGWRAGWEWKPL